MDTNISFTLKVWRQKGPNEKGHFDTLRDEGHPRVILLSSKCWTSSTSSSSRTARSLSSSTMTAVRESAVCAHSISTVIHTDRLRVLLPASSTCAVSTTATSSPSSRGARQPSCHPRLHGRPLSFRQDYRCRRLYIGAHRTGSGRQRYPHP